jgi:hypothetical protein
MAEAIVACALTTFVLGNIAAWRARAVVVMYSLIGGLIDLVDRVEWVCRWHVVASCGCYIN